MATISRENTGLLTDKITVSISKDDYLPAFEQSIKSYAKKANIPGFRKGMVPSGMIKKMYGPGVFTEEVLKKVEKELNDYMSREQPEIFAQPLPVDPDSRQLDMQNPSDYTFAFEIGLKPPFEVDFANLGLTRYVVDVTDTLIDEEIENLKSRHSTKSESEEVNNDEAELALDFIETDGGENELADSISKDMRFPVKYFKEGFRAGLTGKRKGDSMLLDLNNAFEQKEKDYVLKELGLDQDDQSTPQYFKITIKDITQVEKPLLDTDFFSKVYPAKAVDNEADFRIAVKEELQLYWEAQSRNQLHDQIYHKLIDHTQMEFPEGFLKRWLQNGGEQPKTPEQVEEEFPAFISSLKWPLISNKLSDENQIKVEPHEIKDFAKHQLMGYMGGQATEDAPWIDTYAESMMKDKKFIENTYYQLQMNKLFQVLESQIQVTDEKKVTPEELSGMQHHHNH